MRFKVIRYRRKTDSWKFAVVEKRFFTWFAAKVITFTDNKEYANAMCDALNNRKPLETVTV